MLSKTLPFIFSILFTSVKDFRVAPSRQQAAVLRLGCNPYGQIARPLHLFSFVLSRLHCMLFLCFNLAWLWTTGWHQTCLSFVSLHLFSMIGPDFDLLCWNMRGLNWQARKDVVHQTIATTSCHIACLQETKFGDVDAVTASYLGGTNSEILLSS